MPLFMCTKCGCVENTALGHYWVPKFKDGGQPVECSECHTGQWHGRFDKRSADGYFVDNQGFLWSMEEISAGRLPPHAKIVATIVNGTAVPLSGEGE